MKCPDGIHVTAQGQVLVCGRYSRTVLQLDGEGRKKLATLASICDGLNRPQSVFYNRSSASIIVGQQQYVLISFRFGFQYANSLVVKVKENCFTRFSANTLEHVLST
ncbi:hypothetical protein DPMN_184802 [Dreissena polymorpha]|uniref:Uncharacterized protein n=1 Tax=Dreissena polymorpha TaxID=45954 RepID=A0A9D4DK66_DREPO|nr:hypothetical protein DPMN_184761 [Dreissena polymorpha]KAH3750282.1 hypothetical protein DPMN_184802 [Dreissena polymorpha]